MAQRVKDATDNVVTIPGYASAAAKVFTIKLVDKAKCRYRLTRVWRCDLFDKPGLLDLVNRQIGGDGGFDLDKCNYAVAVDDERVKDKKVILHIANNISGLPQISNDFEWRDYYQGKSREERIQENIDRIIKDAKEADRRKDESKDNSTPFKTYPKYDYEVAFDE